MIGEVASQPRDPRSEKRHLNLRRTRVRFVTPILLDDPTS